MGWFGFGNKNNNVIDLSERYKKQQDERAAMNNNAAVPMPQTKQKPQVNFSSLGIPNYNSVQNQANQIPQPSQIQNPQENESQNVPESPEQKRQKFMDKFQEMSERLETISTSLYHLTQRVELIEKKMNLH